MSTHPDESPVSFAPFFSWLLRESMLLRMLSRLVLAVDAREPDEEEEELPNALIGEVAALALPVMLPILILGTRVCIFCSRLRTFARISETICTPLFLAVLEAEEEAWMVGARAIGFRAIDKDGRVVERVMPETGDGRPVGLSGLNPARCNSKF